MQVPYSFKNIESIKVNEKENSSTCTVHADSMGQ